MKKYLLILACSLLGLGAAFSQSKVVLYNSDNILYQSYTHDMDSIGFQQQISVIYRNGEEKFKYPTKGIDSIVFVHSVSVTDTNSTGEEDTSALDSNACVHIHYLGDSVRIDNPLRRLGVSISCLGAAVTVNSDSGRKDISYHISGSTGNGSLTINSDKRFNLILDNVSITNPQGAAIRIPIDAKVSVILMDSSVNYLADSTLSNDKAALDSKGQLIFTGNGKLSVHGRAKHGILSHDYIRILEGDLQVAEAVSDGIHGDRVEIFGGKTVISAKTGIETEKGKFEMAGGELQLGISAADGKGVKACDSILVSGGKISITLTGNQSKGLKAEQMVRISGGSIGITASGSTVLNDSGSGYDPSYCSGIKSGKDIHIGGNANINIKCTNTNKGGKALTAEHNIVIDGGSIELSTAGDGVTYTNASGSKDAYSSSCIKSDGNIYLYAGNIRCSSSGTGAKGIVADSNIEIGVLNARDSNLLLNVTTSGERFTVSSNSSGDGGGWHPGGGGGGWNPGGESGTDYCNPKGIRCRKNLTVNSGVIRVQCTQTGNEGGECIESKAELYIKGGNIEAVSQKDDAINAATKISISDGRHYACSYGNDGIDCNGSMYISGGLTISAGTRSPEEGFDCDQNTFQITGGIIVGTGGATSYPTSTSTQKSVAYSEAPAGKAVCICNASGKEILIMQLPAASSSGGSGGFPGGSSSSWLMLYSSPNLTTGSYSLKYGGSISGGTNYHGYYTGATYSGGSSKTFTISNNAYTSVK